MSMKLRPIAVWRTFTSPGPGSPTSTSSKRNSSGPPFLWMRMALTRDIGISMQSVGRPRDHARRGAVGACDIQRQEHDLGTVPGELFHIGHMLRDQHTAAKQNVMDRKIKILGSQMGGQIGRAEIDAKHLCSALHKPFRRF